MQSVFRYRGCLRFLAQIAALGMLASLLSQCTSVKKADVVVSVKEQKLGLYEQGELKKTYNISTSKFGLGDRPGSNCTPLGQHQVVAKIGHGLPAGAVLKSRRWNGEVLKPNAPGRDPIVSRILWLKGNESSNRNAFGRFIYIHGTPEERRLGEPASYGCVRMGMKDVVNVFDVVNVGAKVLITSGDLPKGEKPKVEKKSEEQPKEAEASPDDDHALPVQIASMQTDPKEKAHAEAKEKAGPEKPAAVKPSSSFSTKKSPASTKSSSTALKTKNPVVKKTSAPSVTKKKASSNSHSAA
jgi:lipoprotein-anchoring transpeptidase ErfK/SrfK